MKIRSHLKEYEVLFEQNFGFLDDIISIPNTLFVIDKNVYELYNSLFASIEETRLIVIEAIEENKVIDTALEICEKLTEIPAKRNATLVSIGGGIIQDITGFVANITYRGINWIFVPTTLLAASDSCIGSKTSLNYKKFKNLLGTFFPPDKIYICPEFFASLSDRDFKSGLGEVVKFNIMMGRETLDSISYDISLLLQRDIETLNKYIHSSHDFKKKFIEADEFDKGERIKLNFAHTFGHAIEVISEYKIPHGTAVAIGMIMADKVSLSRGLMNICDVQKAEDVLMKVIDIDISLLDQPLESYLSAIRKDKKQINADLTAVLISSYESESILSVVHDIKISEVDMAIIYFKELYVNESQGF